MAAITEKGTTSSKTSTTTLTHSNIEVLAGCSLLVGLGYENGRGDPTVKWGNRDLSQLIIRSQSGMTVAWWILRHINNTKTKDIVATWSSSITAKAIATLEIDGANALDVSQGKIQTASDSPMTGGAVTTTDLNTIHLALFGSRGPQGDDAGTPGVGHASGQRVGTVGGSDESNVTIHQTWEMLNVIGNTRALKTGATSRDWANVIVALKLKQKIGHAAISPTDLTVVGEKFEAVDKDFEHAVFWYSPANARWEVYEDSRLTTIVAHQENGWA